MEPLDGASEWVLNDTPDRVSGWNEPCDKSLDEALDGVLDIASGWSIWMSSQWSSGYILKMERLWMKLDHINMIVIVHGLWRRLLCTSSLQVKPKPDLSCAHHTHLKTWIMDFQITSLKYLLKSPTHSTKASSLPSHLTEFYYPRGRRTGVESY
jgi:hypothetical protein